MAKKQSNKYLSSYEEDLIWMSYRYCIGRHTIAAHAHAGNIIRNAYGKMHPDRQDFMAFDIRREIDTVLRWGHPSFYTMCTPLADNEHFKPLEAYIEFVTTKDREELKTIKNIHYDVVDGTPIYDVDYYTSSDTNTYREFSMSDITDLIAWMNVASCFDSKSHKFCKVLNPNTNEVEEIEYFTSYTVVDYQNNKFKKIKVPVAEYVKNPSIIVYLDESAIQT